MILDFIVEYWRLILDGIILILSLVLFIVRKKPISDILSLIYKYAVVAVNQAEKTDYKGDNKLAFASALVIDLLKANFPSLDVEKYYSQIVKTIEDILTTPQKKEV